jgi:hypothetical protein
MDVLGLPRWGRKAPRHKLANNVGSRIRCAQKKRPPGGVGACLRANELDQFA